MKHLFRSLIYTVLIFFVACTDKGISNKEFGDLPDQLIDSLNVLGLRMQIQTIKTDRPNTIVGNKGTIVVIPQDAITDESGNSYKDSIIIELKENFTISDFILSNLQTIHNDKILVSKGMIYINAKDKIGNPLKIADNMSVRIQIPEKDYKDNPKIFLGERDELGHINWLITEEPSKSLVPYPIRFISKDRYSTECSDYYGITKDTVKDKYYNYFGNIEEFENTLLATREFKERFSWICWDSVLNIYIKNINKNMWENDELVVKYLIRDSTRYLNSWVCEPPKGVNGKPVTKIQIEAHKSLTKDAKESYHSQIEMFRNYARQKLTKVDRSKLIDTINLTDINTAYISYDAMKFGWVNVDYFYNDPKSENIKLIAKTNEEVSIISMIIKGRNIILNGIEKGNNEYWFSKNEDGYNKLPKGERATIIAIGLINDELTFGEIEFTIGENDYQLITVKPIKGKDLEKILKNYGS
jgi:hypothetical protein